MTEDWEHMSDPERRHYLWGQRDGMALHMNRVRREQFEAVKCLLILHKPKSQAARFPANVMKFPARAVIS